MKTIIIYHRVDWDGYTSAAVAQCAFPDATLYGWTYKDPIPNVCGYDRVVLVDLTIYSTNSKGEYDFSWMEKNHSKLIWIDHHPIIKEVPGSYRGLREEGIGAAYLTWQYFYEYLPTPDHVKLVATYDVFRKDGWLCSWEDAWAYQLYLNKLGSGWTKEEGDVSKRLIAWATMCILAPDVTIEVHTGYELEEARAEREEKLFAAHASRIIINGFSGWLVETNQQPAVAIKTHLDNHDGDFFILYTDELRSDGTYKVSIRTPEHSKFPAMEYAKAHGGGGHPNACGAYIPKMEMSLLILQAMLNKG